VSRARLAEFGWFGMIVCCGMEPEDDGNVLG
jgi:hypothetical protein